MKLSLCFLIVHLFLTTIVLALPIDPSPSPIHRRSLEGGGHETGHIESDSSSRPSSRINGHLADDEDNGHIRTHRGSITDGYLAGKEDHDSRTRRKISGGSSPA